MVGTCEGMLDGDNVGNSDGTADGRSDGDVDGDADGARVGLRVILRIGFRVGRRIGRRVGRRVGRLIILFGRRVGIMTRRVGAPARTRLARAIGKGSFATSGSFIVILIALGTPFLPSVITLNEMKNESPDIKKVSHSCLLHPCTCMRRFATRQGHVGLRLR